MRINGAHWSDLRRIVVFANIYDGVPNWQQTDGVVTVTMPDQPPIEVRMTEGRNDRRLCGIVLIENDGGRLKATRIVEYVRDQQVLDERFDWGLRWVAGSRIKAVPPWSTAYGEECLNISKDRSCSRRSVSRSGPGSAGR